MILLYFTNTHCIIEFIYIFLQAYKTSLTPSVPTHRYTQQFNASIRPFITGATDVKSDGHCGYRVVALALGLGEDAWRKVRIDLFHSLRSLSILYESIFGRSRVAELKHSIEYFEEPLIAPKDYWMDMPEMGYVIATCYGVVVTHVSRSLCLTCLPFSVHPDILEGSEIREIGIGFVNDDHFVQVHIELHGLFYWIFKLSL